MWITTENIFPKINLQLFYLNKFTSRNNISVILSDLLFYINVVDKDIRINLINVVNLAKFLIIKASFQKNKETDI